MRLWRLTMPLKLITKGFAAVPDVQMEILEISLGELKKIFTKMTDDEGGGSEVKNMTFH